MGHWPNHPSGTEFTQAWLKSSLHGVHSPCQHWREASREDTPSEKIYWGPSWCCLVPVALLLDAQVSSQMSWVDDSIYQRAAAENQHIFENTLWVSWPNSRCLWPPLTPQFRHRPALGYSRSLPSMLSLHPMPQLLSHSTCSSVGGYICTFINTSIMPRGLAGGAALWI